VNSKHKLTNTYIEKLHLTINIVKKTFISNLKRQKISPTVIFWVFSKHTYSTATVSNWLREAWDVFYGDGME